MNLPLLNSLIESETPAGLSGGHPVHTLACRQIHAYSLSCENLPDFRRPFSQDGLTNTLHACEMLTALTVRNFFLAFNLKPLCCLSLHCNEVTCTLLLHVFSIPSSLFTFIVIVCLLSRLLTLEFGDWIFL